MVTRENTSTGTKEDFDTLIVMNSREQNFSYILFLIGMVLIVILKAIGFYYSGNNIFLSDIVLSLVSTTNIVILISIRRIKYISIVTRILGILEVILGFTFVIFGLNSVCSVQKTEEPELTTLIVLLIFLISLSLFYTLRTIGRSKSNINLLYQAIRIKEIMFLLFFVVICILLESIGFYYFEGMVLIIYAINILTESRKIALGKYSYHILISLNGGSQSWEQINQITNRIVLLFAVPVFLAEARNVENLWSNMVGMNYLLKEGLVRRKNNEFELTEKGYEVANEKAKKMIRFLRFIQTLTKPFVSPILSLVLHFFLGTLKLFGFFMTGSVGLLGDGLDSAIDGISSVVVGISMKFKKEVEATYFLLVLMLFSGITILMSSINRILHPVLLNEEFTAFFIAVLSVMSCLLLYLYQRYSGYINQSMTILTQSEDSKNHVLNAILVMIAIIGNELNFLFLDGMVGCFIAILILRGAFALYKDLRDLNQGIDVDFEKYKLGIWKIYGRLQYSMLDNWILYQVLNNKKTKEKIWNEFEEMFRPITIHQNEGEDFIIKFPFTKNDLEKRFEFLGRNDFLSIQDTDVTLTHKGTKKIEGAIKNFYRHEKGP
ncbi:MAG: cation transporter [Candidatus Hodarchaeales archaeon]